jgi:hypothetical protein
MQQPKEKLACGLGFILIKIRTTVAVRKATVKLANATVTLITTVALRKRGLLFLIK